MRVNYPKIEFNHPILEVFKRIEIRVPFRQLNVFEPFGGDGINQTVHYAHLPCVDRLVAWDINPGSLQKFKHWIPDADVKECDSFKEVHKLRPDFDVIIIDNNLLSTQQPFEHFTLFPSIFKGLKDEAFIVIGVCVAPGGYYVPRERAIRSSLGSMTESWVKDWDRARGLFYKQFPMVQPEDYRECIGRIMPLSEISATDMMPIYTEMAIQAGFFTKFHFVSPRSRWMKYIVIELHKVKSKDKIFDMTKDKLQRKAKDETKDPIGKSAKSGN
jgi:hypothetical protein